MKQIVCFLISAISLMLFFYIVFRVDPHITSFWGVPLHYWICILSVPAIMGLAIGFYFMGDS